MRYARFHEGPEGEKEWQSWFDNQPKDFQQEWKDNTEEYREQFKAASAPVADARVALDTSARKMLVAALRQDRRVLSFFQAHARAGDSTAAFFLSAATRLPESTQVRKAHRVVDEPGLYGFPSKTAAFGLHLCAELLAQAGKRACILKKEGHEVRVATYPLMQRLALLSGFQVLASGQNILYGVTRSRAVEVVESLTGASVPPGWQPRASVTLEGYLAQLSDISGVRLARGLLFVSTTAGEEVAEEIGEETPPLKVPSNEPAVQHFNQDEFTQVQEVAHDNLKSATLYEVFGKKAGKRAGVIVQAVDELDAQVQAASHFDAESALTFPKLVAGKVEWEA